MTLFILFFFFLSFTYWNCLINLYLSVKTLGNKLCCCLFVLKFLQTDLYILYCFDFSFVFNLMSILLSVVFWRKKLVGINDSFVKVICCNRIHNNGMMSEIRSAMKRNRMERKKNEIIVFFFVKSIQSAPWLFLRNLKNIPFSAWSE